MDERVGIHTRACYSRLLSYNYSKFCKGRCTVDSNQIDDETKESWAPRSSVVRVLCESGLLKQLLSPLFDGLLNAWKHFRHPSEGSVYPIISEGGPADHTNPKISERRPVDPIISGPRPVLEKNISHATRTVFIILIQVMKMEGKLGSRIFNLFIEKWCSKDPQCIWSYFDDVREEIIMSPQPLFRAPMEYKI